MPGIAWLQAQQPALDQILAEAGRSYYERIRAYHQRPPGPPPVHRRGVRLEPGQGPLLRPPNDRADVRALVPRAARQHEPQPGNSTRCGRRRDNTYRCTTSARARGRYSGRWRSAARRWRRVGDRRLACASSTSTPARSCSTTWSTSGNVSVPGTPSVPASSTSPASTRGAAPSGPTPTPGSARATSSTTRTSRKDLSRDFSRLVGRLQPERVILSTSRQEKKVAFMSRIGERLGHARLRPGADGGRPLLPRRPPRRQRATAALPDVPSHPPDTAQRLLDRPQLRGLLLRPEARPRSSWMMRIGIRRARSTSSNPTSPTAPESSCRRSSGGPLARTTAPPSLSVPPVVARAS